MGTLLTFGGIVNPATNGITANLAVRTVTARHPVFLPTQNWKHYKEVTHPGGVTTEDVTDYWATIYIPADQDLVDSALPSGIDIVFTDESNRILDYTKVVYNSTTGRLEYLVRVPVLTSGKVGPTTIRMWYGNPAQTITWSNQASTLRSKLKSAHAYFPLRDDPTGTSRDFSPKKNNLVSQGSMVAGDLVGGIFNQGTNFQARGVTEGLHRDKADVDMQLGFAASSFFVAAWVRANTPGVNSNARIVNWEAPGTFHGFSMHVTGSDVILFSRGSNTGSVGNVRSTGVDVDDGDWHFVVAEKIGSNSSGWRVWIDGLDRTGTNSGSVSGDYQSVSADLVIGNQADSSNSSHSYDGRIDQVRIGPGTLQTSEIAAYYENDLDPTVFWGVGVEVLNPTSRWSCGTSVGSAVPGAAGALGACGSVTVVGSAVATAGGSLVVCGSATAQGSSVPTAAGASIACVSATVQGQAIPTASGCLIACASVTVQGQAIPTAKTVDVVILPGSGSAIGQAVANAAGCLLVCGSATSQGSSTPTAAGCLAVCGSATVQGDSVVGAAPCGVLCGSATAVGDSLSTAAGCLLVCGSATEACPSVPTAGGCLAVCGSATATGDADPTAGGQAILCASGTATGTAVAAASGCLIACAAATTQGQAIPTAKTSDLVQVSGSGAAVGQAVVSASGCLLACSPGNAQGQALPTAAGCLAACASVTDQGAAVPTAAGCVVLCGSATAVGDSVPTAGGCLAVCASATEPGQAIPTAEGQAILCVSGTVAGQAIPTASGCLIACASATVVGQAMPFAGSTQQEPGTGGAVGQAIVTASGCLVACGAATVQGSALPTASGCLLAHASATVQGQALPFAGSIQVVQGQASGIGQAVVTAAGCLIACASATVQGQSILVATPERTVVGNSLGESSVTATGCLLACAPGTAVGQAIPTAKALQPSSVGSTQGQAVVTASGALAVCGAATIAGQAVTSASGCLLACAPATSTGQAIPTASPCGAAPGSAVATGQALPTAAACSAALGSGVAVGSALCTAGGDTVTCASATVVGSPVASASGCLIACASATTVSQSMAFAGLTAPLEGTGGAVGEAIPQATGCLVVCGAATVAGQAVPTAAGELISPLEASGAAVGSSTVSAAGCLVLCGSATASCDAMLEGIGCAVVCGSVTDISQAIVGAAPVLVVGDAVPIFASGTAGGAGCDSVVFAWGSLLRDCDPEHLPTACDPVFRQMAIDLVEECGRDVSFLVETARAHDRTTNTVSKTVSPTTVRVSPPIQMRLAYPDEDLVQAMRAYLIVPTQGLGFTPTRSMRVEFDGVRYVVDQVDSVYSGHEIAFHRVWIAGGRIPEATSKVSDSDFQWAEDAMDLVECFRRTTTFHVPGNRVHDRTTNTVSTAPDQTFDITTSPPIQFSERFVDGSLVREGDFRLVIASEGLPFLPRLGLKLDLGGARHHIEGIRPIWSGSNVAAYVLHIRSCGVQTVFANENECDEEMFECAGELVDEFGRIVKVRTWRVESLNEGSPDDNRKRRRGLEEHCVKGYPTKRRARWVSGSLVREDGTDLILARQLINFIPDRTVQVEIDGKRFDVLAVKSFATGGNVAAYRLTLSE